MKPVRWWMIGILIPFGTTWAGASDIWPALPEMDGRFDIPAQEWPHAPGPRAVTVYVRYPGGALANVDARTGLMLTLHNWGGTDHSRAPDPERVANRYDVVAISVDYLQSGPYNADTDPPNDFGYLQALDALRALWCVWNGLEMRGTAFARDHIYATGGSGGGNVTLMANKLAPRTFACVVDLSGMARLNDDIAYGLDSGSTLNAGYSRDLANPRYLSPDAQAIRFIGHRVHARRMLALGTRTKIIVSHGAADAVCPTEDVREMVAHLTAEGLDVEGHFIDSDRVDAEVFRDTGHSVGDRTRILFRFGDQYLKPDSHEHKTRPGPSDFELRDEAVRYETANGAFVVSFKEGYPVARFEPGEPVDVSLFQDAISHWQRKYGRDRDDARYAPQQLTRIADNLLRFQNPDGGWPKDLDWLAVIDEAEVRRLRGASLARSGFDNRNTYPQVAYLARAYTETGEGRFRVAAERGLDYILAEQRATGGWRGADVDAITFNDSVMTGIMRLLRAIEDGLVHFAWLDGDRRQRTVTALKRAMDATLACQIVVDGKKTAWCQQHDHATFAPVKARSYELPSITAQESVDVVRFLMSLPDPSPQVIDAIDAAVAWFESAKIHGVRVETIPIDPVRYENFTATMDRVVVADPEAPPIWTRFYEIDTNRPFFCNRDGTKVYTLAEVHHERRTGYGWYGVWPARLIEEDYPAWRRRHNFVRPPMGK